MASDSRDSSVSPTRNNSPKRLVKHIKVIIKSGSKIVVKGKMLSYCRKMN